MKKQGWTFIQVVIVICILGMFIFVGSQRESPGARMQRRLREENKRVVHPPNYPFDSASLSRMKNRAKPDTLKQE